MMKTEALAFQLLAEIRAKVQNPLTIMEVCGTHTMSIARYGLQELLPSEIRLISGPGCPVCVTDPGMISAAMALAQQQNVIFTTFGDMLHVPAGDSSLDDLKAAGADIRIVLSPMDALQLAKQHPEKDVVFFAVGFETTAPLTAAAVIQAKKEDIANFFVFSAHKTMPQAIRFLFNGQNNVNALLCPGHVAVMTGADAFAFVADELNKPAAISGFECCEILIAVSALIDQCNRNAHELVNCYKKAVTDHGNQVANQFVSAVFEPCDAFWRGFGSIAGSGLQICKDYAAYDAAKRFSDVIRKAEQINDHPGCHCGEVLRGMISPQNCPMFGVSCMPESPKGACMVSSEGACAAAYRYKNLK